MRKQFDDLIAGMDSDELLTTGEAAKLLGVSRQHVVDLIDRDELPGTRIGTHRRVRRGDLLALKQGSTRATRDQDRSLWLGTAIAGALVHEPERVRQAGKDALSNVLRPNRWTREWAVILEGPTKDIIRALTSDTIHARELRQNSPFGGVLTPEARETVLEAFRVDRART